MATSATTKPTNVTARVSHLRRKCRFELRLNCRYFVSERRSARARPRRHRLKLCDSRVGDARSNAPRTQITHNRGTRMQRYMAPQHQKAKSVRAQSAACTNTWGRPHDHAHTHAHGARAKRMRGRARIRPHATHVHEHAGARTGAYIHHITLASMQPQSAHMSTRPHARGHTPCRSSSATAPSRRLSAVRPSTRDRSSARSPDAPPRETPQSETDITKPIHGNVHTNPPHAIEHSICDHTVRTPDTETTTPAHARPHLRLGRAPLSVARPIHQPRAPWKIHFLRSHAAAQTDATPVRPKHHE